MATCSCGTSVVVPLLVAISAVCVVNAQDNRRTSSFRETYRSAELRDDGGLAITTSDGRMLRIAPAAMNIPSWKHVGTLTPTISIDRTAVGTIAEYGQDDAPLALIVYRGKLHRFTEGDAIWSWTFEMGGSHIGYEHSASRFADVVSYELREIDTERRIDRFNIALDKCCQVGFRRGGANADMPQWERTPDWVTRLLAAVNRGGRAPLLSEQP